MHDGCDRDGSAGFACQGGRGRNHGSCGRVHSGALSPCGCSLAPAGREVELCRHAGGDHEDDQQGGYDGTNLRVDGEGYGLIIIIINLFFYCVSFLVVWLLIFYNVILLRLLRTMQILIHFRGEILSRIVQLSFNVVRLIIS